MLLIDLDIRSDSSEVFLSLSSNFQDVDGRLLVFDRLMFVINNLFMNVYGIDRKRVVYFMEFMNVEDKDLTKKRFRSLVDVSELFLRDGVDFRFLFFRNNLFFIFEVKVENSKKIEECLYEMFIRRLLNIFDSRLDVVQGFVNFGNMVFQFFGFCVFFFEFMYFDVMFLRVDMFYDLQYFRSLFDIYNLCCFGIDLYFVVLVMRRWLSNLDMFRF